MAEFVTTFNTKEKTLSVSVDGTEIENVTDVEFYKFGMGGDDEPFHAAIVTREMSEDKDMVTVTRVMAQKDDIYEFVKQEEQTGGEEDDKGQVRENLGKALLERR